CFCFFFQAEDGIRDFHVTGVQTCALPILTAELHLPVGRPVIFKFRSQDVLHSAYFPHFRAQMNVVPGMTTQFAFTPTVTTKEIRSEERRVGKECRSRWSPDNKNKDWRAVT